MLYPIKIGVFFTILGYETLFRTSLWHMTIDKFAPFHNWMSIIYNIFVKFLQTIYFHRAESVRKIDAQLKFQYTGCLIWYLGKKSQFLDKKVEKVIGPSYFTVKLSLYKTTSDMFRILWAFKTRELIIKNNCFAIQRYRALNLIIFLSLYKSISLHFLF